MTSNFVHCKSINQTQFSHHDIARLHIHNIIFCSHLLSQCTKEFDCIQYQAIVPAVRFSGLPQTEHSKLSRLCSNKYKLLTIETVFLVYEFVFPLE